MSAPTTASDAPACDTVHMSDPTFDPDEMLTWLAVLDLEAAEHVHARLMAAKSAEAVADLGHVYQEAAQSVRETLALQSQLRREAAAGARRRSPLPLRSPRLH